jgi:hypothetical protein
METFCTNGWIEYYLKVVHQLQSIFSREFYDREIAFGKLNCTGKEPAV